MALPSPDAAAAEADDADEAPGRPLAHELPGGAAGLSSLGEAPKSEGSDGSEV